MSKNKTVNEVVQDDDLIKIKTIKVKHLDQLLDTIQTVGEEPKFSEGEVEMLYYIKGRDVILCRSKSDGHLRAVRAITIVISAVENATVSKDGWQAARDGAWARIYALPQLLID